MSIPQTKSESRQRIRELISAFKRNEADYIRAGSVYNETQARTDFITPLLEAFGWDVHNTKGQPLDLREVFEEATVEVGEERLSKKPDYELRLARQRKLFVEAKKPCVRIDHDRSASFQTRRYGFSASLPISILTNFHQLAIYDCVPPPCITDEAQIARIGLYSYDEFDTKFDELYDKISRESIYTGRFDRIYNVSVAHHGTQQFDGHFLKQVRSWRERLAVDIKQNTANLTASELSYIVQRFLSRIVFLRICEDREIEKYETLKDLSQKHSFASLMEVLKRADLFYDSGLFRLLDDERLNVKITDSILRGIIQELYYPASPYTFAVVETSVLGEIYELFLGEVITFDSRGQVQIVEKPEVRESGGIVPTPRFVVDAIVDRTLKPYIDGKSPSELTDFTVADICCGSGTFLLGAYEYLLNHHLNWYLSQMPNGEASQKIYEIMGGQWRLTFEEKRRILMQHIRGVDIDSNAVEVSRLSLLLKLIEDETADALNSFVARYRVSALPSLDQNIRCGNSLVEHNDFSQHQPHATTELIEKINPFTWKNEFPAEMERGGFDVIIGNPPYIRIQNMVAYSPEEVNFYQNAASPYQTRNQNFDKYFLFLERAIALVRTPGLIGMIVPNKFMITAAGRDLRRVISGGRVLKEIVHFGAQQVFGAGASNYTCIIILDSSTTMQFDLERVRDITKWRYGAPGDREKLESRYLTDAAWPLASELTATVFDKIKSKCRTTLGEVADIFVGVQTSADEIYIIIPKTENGEHVIFDWNEQEWSIERNILRPCLYDVSLQAYSKPKPNTYIIFPYHIGTQRARLIQPDEMQSQFPHALAYLTARRAALEQRNVQGGINNERQWYQYGRSQSLTKFDSPKIILPILSLEPRYAYDDQNIVVTGGGNGPYYLVRPKNNSEYSIFVLMAILCHSFSEAMLKTRTSVFRGGYYSHGKQFIEVLPMPEIRDVDTEVIDDYVQRAIKSSAEAEASRTLQSRTIKERETVALREHIEQYVSQLFGLSSTDLDIVRTVEI